MACVLTSRYELFTVTWTATSDNKLKEVLLSFTFSPSPFSFSPLPFFSLIYCPVHPHHGLLEQHKVTTKELHDLLFEYPNVTYWSNLYYNIEEFFKGIFPYSPPFMISPPHPDYFILSLASFFSFFSFWFLMQERRCIQFGACFPSQLTCLDGTS